MNMDRHTHGQVEVMRQGLTVIQLSGARLWHFIALTRSLEGVLKRDLLDCSRLA